MWTACALASEIREYDGRVIRIVEAQHRISTNRLAATAEDQQLLETLADDVKPNLPADARRLPWLLAAPFRYGFGRPSRFRAENVWPGIFYASEEVETAVTEAAYWRILGFSRSPGFQRPRTPTPMSAFAVRVRAVRALDLMAGRLARDHHLWAHPADYSATQALAAAAREADVQALRAPSARKEGGRNVAVLAAAALVPPPRPHSSWAFTASDNGLIATREMSNHSLRFAAADFDIPAPTGRLAGRSASRPN